MSEEQLQWENRNSVTAEMEALHSLQDYVGVFINIIK
jgi:hypothetical protein